MAQKTLRSYFDSRLVHLGYILKAHKHSNDKKKIEDIKKYFPDKTKPVQKQVAEKETDKLVAYCESLYDVYNWLNDKGPWGCSFVEEVRNQICMPAAAQIADLFTVGGQNSSQKKNGNKIGQEKNKASVPSVKIEEQKTSGHAKPKRHYQKHQKKSPFADIGVPQEKKTEVTIKEAQPKMEMDPHENKGFFEGNQEIHNIPAVDEVQDKIEEFGSEPRPRDYPEEIDEVIESIEQIPEIKVHAADENHPELKRVKRVIILEVMACEGCKEDVFLKKYLETKGK